MLRRRAHGSARKGRPKDVAARASSASAMRKYPWTIGVVFLLLTGVFLGSAAAFGLFSDFGSQAAVFKIQLLQPLLFLFSAPITLATAVATLMLAHAATTIAGQQSRVNSMFVFKRRQTRLTPCTRHCQWLWRAWSVAVAAFFTSRPSWTAFSMAVSRRRHSCRGSASLKTRSVSWISQYKKCRATPQRVVC